MLSITINIFFTVLFIYYNILKMLRNNNNRLSFIYTLRKPLVEMSMNLFMIYVQPLVNTTTLLYFLLYSKQLFALLDEFYYFYNNKQYYRYFLVCTTVCNLLYTPILYSELKQLTLKDLLWLLISFILFTYNFLSWMAVIYCKLATWLILCEIHHNLINNHSIGLYLLVLL